jgi:hypothetical protein
MRATQRGKGPERTFYREVLKLIIFLQGRGRLLVFWRRCCRVSGGGFRCRRGARGGSCGHGGRRDGVEEVVKGS